jgi:outer membrane protein TolC
VALLGAENNRKNALAALAKASGLDHSVVRIASETVIMSEVATAPEALLKESLERPDLIAARRQAEAAKLNEKEARMGKRPTLSGSADYSWGGSVTPLDRSYTMGLSLSAPILDGSLTKAQVKDAQGQVMSAEGRLAEQIQSTRAQLEVAINDVEETRERIVATTILLQQASETLLLAEGRYEEGVGSALEVTDARAGYTNARGSHVSATFDHLIALTTLERILGRIPAEALTTPVQP